MKKPSVHTTEKQKTGWVKRHGFSAALYLMAAVLALGLIGNAAAKYFQTSADEGMARANWFYFTSNMEEGSPHRLNPGETSVTFTVGNHIDSLRYSEMDLKYQVSVSPGLDDDDIVYADAGKRLKKGEVREDSITLNGLKPGTTYEVTVTGEPAVTYADGYTGAKYQKTLTFKLVVPQENTLYQYFEKKDGYILLTVWAQGYQGDVNITYPETVVPDNTSTIGVMQTATAGAGETTITDTATFASSAYASAQYRFFILSGTPTAGDFEVTDKNGTVAAFKTPD